MVKRYVHEHEATCSDRLNRLQKVNIIGLNRGSTGWINGSVHGARDIQAKELMIRQAKKVGFTPQRAL